LVRNATVAVLDMSARKFYHPALLLLLLSLVCVQVRIAGDSKTTDTAFCVGYKPNHR
jgi:hypothetical protein